MEDQDKREQEHTEAINNLKTFFAAWVDMLTPEESREAMERIEAIVRAMPEQEAETMIWKTWSRYTIEEIADEHGLTASEIEHQYRAGLSLIMKMFMGDK